MFSVSILQLCIALPSALRGQGLGPIVLTQAGSTRALSLGNAFVLGSTDSDAIFYNAAFLEQLRGIGGSVQWIAAEGVQVGRLVTVSGAAEWWRGAVAVGVKAMHYDAVGDDIFPAHAPASGLVAAVTHARRVWRLRLAATGKLVEQRLGDHRDATVAFDLATAANVSFFSFGLAVQDVGPHLDVDASFADNDLPSRVTLALATRARPLGPLDILATGAFTTEFDGDITAGSGVELAYWPVSGRTFAARLGGLRDAGGEARLTLGAGFTGDRIAVDYVFVSTPERTHRIGLRWR